MKGAAAGTGALLTGVVGGTMDLVQSSVEGLRRTPDAAMKVRTGAGAGSD